MDKTKKKLLETETQEEATMGLDSDHSSNGQTLFPELNTDNDTGNENGGKRTPGDDFEGDGLIGNSPLEDK
ncbi:MULTISPECIES: hypothetical protein [Pedobacter]|uniref:hypothetical protein n=1 Tax=Pedobacter TaxID=84567 RepID=UPI00210B5572|nr:MULTISPECIES: hypothetical protein [unclassified Pedobacter]